jgi:transposase InsO family protein
MGPLGNDFGSIAVIVAVLRQSSEAGGGVKTERTNPGRSRRDALARGYPLLQIDSVACLSHFSRTTRSLNFNFISRAELSNGDGIICSMSRSGNVWDNAAMESFFSSLKTERIARKVYRTRNEAKADVFDYIERFYNTIRRHSTIGYVSPVAFERKLGLA